MKTKLEMAHDYAMKHIQEGWDINYDVLVVEAWQYADAMQSEADKRKPSGLPESLRERHDFTKAIAKGVENYEKEKWQPDWSQAPNGYDYWVATADHDGKISGGWFYGVEPEFGESKGVSIYYSSNNNSILTDSFGYKGDWRNSLRKRPK